MMALWLAALAMAAPVQGAGKPALSPADVVARVKKEGAKAPTSLYHDAVAKGDRAAWDAIVELDRIVVWPAQRRVLVAEYKHFSGKGDLASRAVARLEALLAGDASKDWKTAGRALAYFGDPAHRILKKHLDGVGRKRPSVRLGCVVGLGAFNPPREILLLAAAAVEDKSVDVRSAAVTALGRAKDSEAAGAALVQALEDEEVRIRATAWRALAKRGHKDLKRLALKAAGQERAAAIRGAMVDVFAGLPGSDSAKILIEWGPTLTGAGRTKAVEALRNDPFPKTESLLVKEVKAAARDTRATEALFLIEVLRDRDSEAVTKVLRGLLSAKTEAVQVAAVRALGHRKAEDAVTDLDRKARSKRSPEAMRAACVAALAQIRGNDPEWAEALLRMAGSRDWVMAAAAADALGAMRWAAARQTLLDCLDRDPWQLRVSATKALVALRAPQAVPALIARLDHEGGRVGDAMARGLRDLTGMRFGDVPADWQRWWKDQGPGWTPPPWETIRDERERLEAARVALEAQGGVTRAGFYGIPMISDRAIFVIDTSGSMAANLQVGTSTMTRLEMAKRELLGVLASMSTTARLNIIGFSTGLGPWSRSMMPANSENLEEARLYVERMTPAGGTNIYGALKLAFEDPDVDTVYFLSDGSPSGGAVQAPTEIREAVRRWNQVRKIVIHTVSVGQDLPLLKWLSNDTDGQHIVRK